MGLSDLSENMEDLYIVARFRDRIGKPIISDSDFDKVDKYIRHLGVLPEYTSRLYDDDPIPFELLHKYNLSEDIPNLGTTSEYAKYLDEDKSLSIEPFTEYEDVYNFMMSKPKQDFVMMLKVDGVNSKSAYIDCDYKLSLSRGRHARTCLDYTKGLSRILPIKLKAPNDEVSDEQMKEVKVYGEAFVDESYLPVLRSKYDADGYKTSKSSALSLLRVDKSAEDYEHLRALMFNAEGLPNIKTKIDMLETLVDLGFTVVPYVLLNWDTIPKNLETFIPWLEELCEEFYVKTEMYPSDGLVLEVNDLNYEDTVSGIYSNKNIALKLSYWAHERYIGEVTGIILEQQKVRCCCKVSIKPMRTKDGCEAKVVNVHNPKILIDNNINIGSKIVFERNSGAINTLIYGNALNK